ncbi:D-alanyl-D-alanine carboxypeptidase family protein [Alteribacillus sp. HJP-4]|uniref:D-alanyl-D-alanine carboxypeptidase family protein n=1 Tax=Alteribacillus sp. HJP-4 TaxID=2775394 RepID=UPI0035CD205C
MIKKNIKMGAAALIAGAALVFPLTNAEAQEPELDAKAAILVDAQTGKVVYGDSIDVILPPASMTKIMTEYIIHEAIQNEDISWEDEVEISDNVRNLSLETSLSNVPLRQDETYTVRELYEALAIYSANGATIALAEHIAGTETEFVALMNEKAEELEMKDYEFVNSTGLNNQSLNGNHPEGTGADEENMMSARSTAILSYHLLKDFPEILETTSVSEKVFKEDTEDYIEMQNWNWMLPGGSNEYEGVDGLKTGFTDMAGNAFTGTAERDDMRYISVVMKTDTRESRFEETAKLLDYGFDSHASEELVTEGQAIDNYDSFPVTKGKEDSVSASAGESLSLLIGDGEQDSIETNVKLNEELVNEEGELEAPLKKGDKIGTITVSSEDEEYLTESLAEGNKVPLVLNEDVEKADWFTLSMRGIGVFFGNVWDNAAGFVKGLF